MERIRMLPQVSREYRKIEAKWRKVHLNTACLLTLIAVIAETGLFSRGLALQEVKEMIRRVPRDFFTLSLTGLEENCLTLSAEITRYIPGIALEKLIVRADQAAYRSKGKNSVHVCTENKKHPCKTRVFSGCREKEQLPLPRMNRARGVWVIPIT